MTVWIGILFAACVIAVLALMAWRRHVEMAELGTVTSQWLSEHRNDHSER
jgi:hypothetical protein